jgi:hypothetical protein
MQLTRRRALKGLAVAAAGLAAGSGAYGFVYERVRLTVARATLRVAALPPALDGLRIGLLTDIHHSLFMPQEDVARAAGLLRAAQPDLVVLGGDYVTWDDRRYVVPCAEALAPLAAEVPHGVFAVLGNHDDDRYVPAALERVGFTVLRDQRTRTVIKGEALELVGIRFWTRRARDIAAVARGANGPVLLLAHDPRRLAEAASLDIPLVLSGHTHGGQVVLPIIGAVAARRYPVVAGAGTRGRTAIFVSRGLGTVFVPVRLNCPPEVAVLTLRRGSA